VIITPRSRAVSLAALMLISLMSLLGFSGAAHAIDNGTLGIRPATEPDYFHLSVAAGSTLAETAIVSNHTAEAVTLLTYVVDGTTTPQGGVALGPRDGTPQGLGLWTTLTASSITVPPDSDMAVPFTINVPIGTMPGDYIGGLVIQAPVETGQVSSSADGTSVRIDVVNRQGVRIYLNVAGQSVTKLEAGKLSWTKADDNVSVTLAVTNTGNTTLHPQGSVDFASALGANKTLTFITPESIMPGATVELRTILSPAALIQIGEIRAEVRSEAPTISQSTAFVSVPWWILLGVVIVLAVIWLLVRRQILFTRRARLAFARLAAQDQPLPAKSQKA
jgi:hypothetical protein